MEILYVTTSYPPALGGAQIHLHSLASAIRDRGHGVRVVTQWSRYRNDWLFGSTVFSDPPKNYEYRGIEVSQIGFPPLTRLMMAPWVLLYYFLMSASVRRVSSHILPFLPQAGMEPALIHATRIGREFIARAALDCARERGIPFVLTPNHHPRWHGYLYREYDKIYREADAVIALTEFEKRTLVREKGVDEGKVHVTGIAPVLTEDYSIEGFRERYGVKEKFVLFLGQQYGYKGIGAILSAAPMVWKAHPEVSFVFVGPHTGESIRLFRKHHDRRIVNLGPLEGEAKTSALAACDFLCVPSEQESFGGVYVEAWTLRKAVIGGRIGPVASVIDDGTNGLLSGQEPNELAEKVSYLLSNPSVAERMGNAGWQKASENYTWDRLATKTLHVYERVRS